MKKLNNFYNTNNECADELKKSNKQANSQELKILEIFDRKIKLSASEAWTLYDNSGRTPISSIRRAITNLYKEGKLVKTDEKTDGIYGKKEHIYLISLANSPEFKNKTQLPIF